MVQRSNRRTFFVALQKPLAVVCAWRRAPVAMMTGAKSGIQNLETSAFDPPEGSLRRSVGRGAVVTAMAQGVRVATQIVSVI
ncbi:MAG: hypothetical protein E5X90_23560, partial [Mesorhizobium sp.]